jgi:hypothetical protein
MPLSSEDETKLAGAHIIIAPLKGDGQPNARVAQKAEGYEKNIAKGKCKRENLKPGDGFSLVLDINRASIMLADGPQMIKFVMLLRHHKLLNVVRLKNHFSELGPTHYRRLGTSIGVAVGKRGFHICELQVHQKEIHDNAPDHLVYEYFRELFSDDFDGTMGQWMKFELKMNLLKRTMEVPVLMSMLIFAMACGEGQTPHVPVSEFELYQMVLEKHVEAIIEDFDLTIECLVLVASFAQARSGLRIFGTQHVQEALGHKPDLLACWHRLVQLPDMPCFKVIDMDSKTEAYQSKHLSIQGGLITADVFVRRAS